MRRKAADSGIEIYAVAANNDFSSPIPEYRECQLTLGSEVPAGQLRPLGDQGRLLEQLDRVRPAVRPHDSTEDQLRVTFDVTALRRSCRVTRPGGEGRRIDELTTVEGDVRGNDIDVGVP